MQQCLIKYCECHRRRDRFADVSFLRTHGYAHSPKDFCNSGEIWPFLILVKLDSLQVMGGMLYYSRKLLYSIQFAMDCHTTLHVTQMKSDVIQQNNAVPPKKFSSISFHVGVPALHKNSRFCQISY